MDFIDGNRGVLPVVLLASLQPLFITPFIVTLGRYDRSGIRTELELIAVGVTLEMHMPFLVQDLIFIIAAWFKAGNK
jgi:hypothetical protein